MSALVRRLAALLLAIFALSSCARLENPYRHWPLDRAFSLFGSFAWLADPYWYGGLELVLEAKTEGMGAAARDQALDRAVGILRERMKDFGIRGAEVTRTAEGRILVRLPIDGRKGDAASRAQRAIRLIGRTGSFEFKLVRTSVETKAVFDRLDTWLAASGAGAGAGMDTARRQTPLSAYFIALGNCAFVRNEDLPNVQKLLATAGVDSVVTSDSQLLWGQPDDSRDGVTGRALCVVKRAPELTGGSVASAEPQLGLENTNLSAWGVSMKMTPQGRAKFARITGNNVGRQLAIVLDDIVTSAPLIRERIPSGEASITGSFDDKSAKDLAVVLRAGALPARLELLRSTPIPPK
jgi:protein-export membrane protein SecD